MDDDTSKIIDSRIFNYMGSSIVKAEAKHVDVFVGVRLKASSPALHQFVHTAKRAHAIEAAAIKHASHRRHVDSVRLDRICNGPLCPCAALDPHRIAERFHAIPVCITS